MTTYTLSSSISNGITIGFDGIFGDPIAYGNPFTITQSGTIDTGDVNAVFGLQDNTTLINEGLVYSSSTSPLATAVAFNSGGYVANLGISATINGQIGIHIQGLLAGTVVNSGSINGTTRGVYFGQTGGTVANSGTISGGTDGILSFGGGYVANLGSAAQISSNQTGVALFSTSTLLNEGTITGGNYAVALSTNSNPSLGNLITNRGTAALLSGGLSGIQTAGPSNTIVNEGTIHGGHYGIHAGYATITNSGSASHIYGGNFGIKADYVATIVNDGTIFGGRYGIDIVSGAITNSNSAALISGGSYGGMEVTGGIGIVINAGTIQAGQRSGVALDAGGTIVNSGTIAGANGNAAVDFNGTYTGADLVVVDPGAVFTGAVNGGKYAVNTLEFGAGAGSLTGIGSQFTSFTNFLFDAGAAWAVSGTATAFNHATISGLAPTDTLDITGFAATSASFSGDVLVLSNATASETLTLNGMIGPRPAVSSDGAGGTDITGGSAAVLALDISTGITLTASGAYTSPFTITSFATIEASGAYGVFSALGGASLENHGVVEGALIGAALTSGGTISNLGTAATLTGSGFGIYISGGTGSVANAGTISGAGRFGIFLGAGGTVSNSGTAAMIGGAYGVEIDGGSGTVTNEGIISGPGRYGVALLSGGLVANTGTAALITGAQDGVEIRGAGTLINTGTIISTDTDASFRYYFAAALTGGGTIINSGLISGVTDAASFGGSGDNLLVVEKGAAFHGGVTASGTGNTLEFAATASAGTLGGIGSQIQGFETITFDAGANWIATGDVAGLLSGQTIAGLATGSVLDITDFAATSETYMAGIGLVLSDGTSFATLVLQGVNNPAQLAIASDGANGTDITNSPYISSDSFGSGITLTAAGNYRSPFTLTSFGTITTGGGTGVYSVLAGAELTNEGLINAGSGYGVFMFPGGTVVNSGHISGGSGIEFGGGGLITNAASGTISGSNQAILTFPAYAGSQTILNAGTIISTGSGPAINIEGSLGYISNLGAAARISASGYAIELVQSGTVLNSGSIVSSAHSGVLIKQSGTVTNSAATALISGTSYGVQIRGTLGNVSNAGTITGGNFNAGVGLSGAGTLANTTATALIKGGYYGVYIHGNSTVLNAGSIIAAAGYGTLGAAVRLDAYGLVRNTGLIQGRAFGIKASNNRATVVNSGTIIGAGSDGIALLYGGTVSNSGLISGHTDAIYFTGSSNDLLQLGAGASFAGAVVAQGNGNMLELTSSATAGTIAGIGNQITGFSTIAFDAGATWDITGNLAGLANGETITGFTQGDTIELAGFAATSASITSITSGTLLVLSDGVSTATLDVSGNFLAGLISISTDGTETTITAAVESHTLTNQIGTGITLVASGGYDSAFTIAPGGAVDLQYGNFGAAVYSTLSAATLINEGLVNNVGTTNPNGAHYGTGVFFTHGGYVANSGVNATISGGDYGVHISGQSADPAGTVFNSGTIAGYFTGVRLYGTGDALTNSGTAALISGSRIAVYLQDSGTVTNEGTLIGTGTNSSAGVIISGNAGNELDNNGTAARVSGYYVGASAYSQNVTINNAGTIMNWSTSSGRAVYARSGGLITNNGTGAVISGYSDGVLTGYNPTTIENSGLIIARGTAGDGIELKTGGTVFNSGTISGSQYAVYFNDSYGGSSGIANGHDLLKLDPGAVFTGTVKATGTENTLEFGSNSGAGSLSSIGTQFLGFDTIAFDTGATWTLEGSAAGLANGQTITGFQTGDTLDLTGIGLATSETFSGGVLTLTSGGNSYMLDIAGHDGLSGTEYFALSGDGHGGTDITTVFCFLGGTHIATPYGETKVEDLARGDLVLTADGNSVPVRWIGLHTVAARFADPLRIMPIRIREGALGDGLPVRDLLLSPDHAMYLDGILVQAAALVNGISITRERNMPARFIYYHIELANHDLVLAEGAASETFVDNVDRMNFDNWAEHEALYANAPRIAELPYPRAKSARQLPRLLRDSLNAHAQDFGRNSQRA